jgi:hypothetical protein
MPTPPPDHPWIGKPSWSISVERLARDAAGEFRKHFESLLPGIGILPNENNGFHVDFIPLAQRSRYTGDVYAVLRSVGQPKPRKFMITRKKGQHWVSLLSACLLAQQAYRDIQAQEREKQLALEDRDWRARRLLKEELGLTVKRQGHDRHDPRYELGHGMTLTVNQHFMNLKFNQNVNEAMLKEFYRAIMAVFDRRQLVPSEAKTTWERLDEDDDT